MADGLPVELLENPWDGTGWWGVLEMMQAATSCTSWCFHDEGGSTNFTGRLRLLRND